MGATIGILAGAGLNVASQQQQAAGVLDQSRFDMQLAELAATDATTRGDMAASERARRSRQIVSAQRAALGASGIELDSGTPANLQADEAYLSALDEHTIRNNAAREAWGYRTQSSLNQLAARNDAANTRAQSYGTLLTGATNAYGIYRSSHQPTTTTQTPTYTRRTFKPDTAVLGPARFNRENRY